MHLRRTPTIRVQICGKFVVKKRIMLLLHAKSMEATPTGVKMPEKMQTRLVTPL